MKIISNQPVEHFELELEMIDSKELIIIDLNIILHHLQKKLDRIGLAIAKEYVEDENNIVILLSVEKEDHLLHDERFGALMARGNVGFSDFMDGREVPAIYKALASGQKRTDRTALAVYEFQAKCQAVDLLKQSLLAVQGHPEELKKWLERAKEAGFNGESQEVICQVKSWYPDDQKPFAGQMLDGIFVDAFNTLFDSNWALNLQVKKTVQDLAVREKQKIFILSDSDPQTINRELEKNEINWQLISKYDLRGATLGTVVDVLPAEVFKAVYDISAKRFVRAEELVIAD